MTEPRLYLNVPFAEKDQAKALGARWDPARKKWYVPGGKGAEAFARWQPEALSGNGIAEATPDKPSKASARPSKGESSLTIAITQPLDKNFVPYSGAEPPWDV